jgi:flagellar biosynthesis protein FlhF
MKVKTYRAPSMKQALEEVKKELGSDAFILSGKEIKPKKVLGVFGTRSFEVTAAVDHTTPVDTTEKPVRADVEKTKDHVQFSEAAVRKGDNLRPAISTVELSVGKPEPALLPEVRFMLEEIRSLKSMIQSIPNATDRRRPGPSSVPREFSHAVYREIYFDLLASGLNEELARDLVDQAMNKGKGKTPPSKLAMKRKIATALSRRIKVVGDLVKERPCRGPQVIAFVGPTGVGKTTTLAKLAARAVLEEQLSVGLITLDTFRIAAIEQLKTYAEIIGIPTRVVESVSQMNDAIKEFGPKDLILIDTAGKSQRELGTQLEVAQFFNQSASMHKSLVLSATTKESDLADIIRKYGVFGPDSVIVTKLDETEVYGHIFNELIRAGSPLAYVTVGQNVPRDILKPDPAKLVNLALHVGDCSWEHFICDSKHVRTPGYRSQNKPAELCVGAR